jgi:hypothetical protein
MITAILITIVLTIDGIMVLTTGTTGVSFPHQLVIELAIGGFGFN